MSSLARRLGIRAMKRAGYTREKWIIVKNARGEPEPRMVRRGGEITDRNDNPIGRRWPTPRASAPAQPTKPNPVAHALRRSKRSQKWLEARAKARGGV